MRRVRRMQMGLLWLWRRKRLPRTQQEMDAESAEAMRRAEQANTRLDQLLAEMKKSQEDAQNRRGGPGGPDDSAGAVRVG